MNKTTILLASAMTALSSLSDGLSEDETGLVIELDRQESVEVECDLRTVFPVAKLKNEPALQGFGYSARGWCLDVPIEDPDRTAEIVAEPGVLANGVFTPEGAAVVVMSATEGEGWIDWQPSSVEKGMYRLTHTARVRGTGDGQATCYGYLDFTQCADSRATQEQVEVAALDGVSHMIALTQDEEFPWQPIEMSVAGAGIATDAQLVSETTTTVFSFKGHGTFHYEYVLSGGSLEVRADGVPVETLQVSGWQMRTVQFEGFGAHTVAFVHVAAKGGRAGLRSVRWEEEDDAVRLWGEENDVRMDLRHGIRTAKCADEILPFVYSSTNWIGVAGATAGSKARVTIMQMSGTGPDVTNWTDVVSGSFKELVNKNGEGEKKWRPRKGVWKATFDILNDETSIYSADAWFDLRKTSMPGFALIIF